MFEASIPQIKEGKPLSSLTSLRITRPAAYPGPPILHLVCPSHACFYNCTSNLIMLTDIKLLLVCQGNISSLVQ